ncbi:MAG: hypothetical protein M1828_007047 [Chrysothrix sp. TS-e1954]|nr:MAG: hypothetical protein M1828_007047 [Chrysothrix sp. TS-e1954]
MSSGVDEGSLQKLRIADAIKNNNNDAEYDSQLCHTCEVLASFSQSSLASIDLDKLDPTLDTLPYLSVLVAKKAIVLKKGKGWPESWQPDGEVWRQIIRFLSQCNPREIRYDGAHWRQLVEVLFMTDQKPSDKTESSRTLDHVAAALLRLDPSSSTLTSLHPPLIEACLQSRNARAALMILEKDISSLPLRDPSNLEDFYLCSQEEPSSEYVTEGSGLTGKLTLPDVQKYYLHGAMIFIGVENWRRAKQFLEHVLMSPTQSTANGLMVEAYQKWVLVHLLAKDSEGEVPKQVNSQALKTIKAVSRQFENVAAAFKLEDSKKLRAEVEAARSTWQQSGNRGLVDHVMRHHQRLFVLRFEKLYAAMPLQLVAEELRMSQQDATTYVSSLIESGNLKARIEPGKAQTILHFARDSELDLRSDERLRDELLLRTNRIKVLQQHIEEADRRLGLSKEYVENVRRSRKKKEERQGPDEEAMEMSFGPPGSEDDDALMELTGDGR